VLLAAGLLLAPFLSAQDKIEPERLLTVRPGSMPIILSAPHGGRVAVPDVKERKGGEGVLRFVTVRDGGTDDLAEKLAAALEKKLGARPFVVIAKFERKYIDVNRPSKDAYEMEAAKPYYDAYHKALADARKTVQKDWGRGLLLDIHGQGAEAGAIFRGTGDGLSVKHLRDRFGKEAVTGPKSVLGVLATKGYTIIPANNSEDKEDRRYNGGYTVRTYGSNDGGAFDALQMELGATLRQAKNLDKTAADIAEAVAVFAKEYLPAEKNGKP